MTQNCRRWKYIFQAYLLHGFPKAAWLALAQRSDVTKIWARWRCTSKSYLPSWPCQLEPVFGCHTSALHQLLLQRPQYGNTTKDFSWGAVSSYFLLTHKNLFLQPESKLNIEGNVYCPESTLTLTSNGSSLKAWSITKIISLFHFRQFVQVLLYIYIHT